MLPASLQTPAAIVLVAGGLLSCFAGHRVFRVVLGIYGFILGALLASSFMGAEQTLWMIVAALAGGLAGSVILILAYFVGVALIGAGVGALTANVAWAAFGREPGMWAVILLAIAGALAGDRVANQAASKNDVWLAYPLNPAPGQRWVLLVWFVMGLIGAFVQLAITATGGKQRSRA